MLPLMKISDHMIGDRVSVRVRRSFVARQARQVNEANSSWLGGRVIGCDARPTGTRYVVQLDDDRRVAVEGAEVRRWSLSFELYETLEKMAS
jgi:hypothetical protein